MTSPLSRRLFLRNSALAAAALPTVLHAAGVPGALYQQLAAADRQRTLRNAARWAAGPPRTLTSFPHPPDRPGDTPHQYVSDSDYFWPDPKNPAGPYRERDGVSNPTNFNDHRLALIRMSQAMPALAAGYKFTGKRAWGAAAAAHLRAWFVTPETRMDPDLRYAQGVRNGGPTGRQYGVIDTLHLAEVARAAPVVRPFLTASEWESVLAWFRAYLTWMNSSDLGTRERDGTNNHGIAWALQAAEFARLTGDGALRADIRRRWREVQLPTQMAADGSFPRETRRTKPFGYSIFTFDCAAMLAWSLGGAEELRWSLPDGRGLCRAAAWLEPFVADKSTWPFPHDVQHWDAWPVRSPGLLFSAHACDHRDWLAMLARLNPDPTDPEVVRNFPVRQPLLWA